MRNKLDFGFEFTEFTASGMVVGQSQATIMAYTLDDDITLTLYFCRR
jgi:hypothetical protein